MWLCCNHKTVKIIYHLYQIIRQGAIQWFSLVAGYVLLEAEHPAVNRTVVSSSLTRGAKNTGKASLA